MRAYAHTRSVNIAVANNIARAPLVVPTPHFCISGYCGIAYGLLVAGRMQSSHMNVATHTLYYGILWNSLWSTGGWPYAEQVWGLLGERERH